MQLGAPTFNDFNGNVGLLFDSLLDIF